MTATNPIIVRRFAEADAPTVSQLIIANLLLVNSRDYGQDAVQQLARFYSPELLLEYARTADTFVALQGTAIIGTATLDQDRVRNVFVHMDHHQQGIGRLLMCTLEELACRRRQPRLILYASLAAVDFYQKLGYRMVEEVEDPVGEASIRVVVMEKILS